MQILAQILFGIILIAGIGFFARNVRRMIRNIKLGKKVDRTDQKGERFKTMALLALGQSKMVRRPISGILHIIVYLGFIIINKLKSKNIFAFAGIGFPSKFYNLLKNNNLKVIKTKDFPDHHKFNYGQLSELVKESQRCNADLVTTEKDYVKISEMNGIIKKYILPFPIKLKMENEKFFIDELKKFLDEKN